MSDHPPLVGTMGCIVGKDGRAQTKREKKKKHRGGKTSLMTTMGMNGGPSTDILFGALPTQNPPFPSVVALPTMLDIPCMDPKRMES